jgi:hypothetical protein
VSVNAHSKLVTLSPMAGISQAPLIYIRGGLCRRNGVVGPELVDRRPPVDELGLVWRTVDPLLLDDTTLTGDTTLSLAQVVLCLRRMLTMVPSRHAHDAANSLPWHTDWLSSAELGFPLVADQSTGTPTH